MKIVIFFLCQLLIVSTVIGQTNSNQGFLVYKVLRGNNTRIFNLYFDNQESIFVLDKNHTVDSSGALKSVAKKSNSSNNYSQSCNVNDSIPKLDWKLLPEQKNISGFKCQKAITFFRCSTYTAWFTNAIPVNIGPWKIGGLPGLILELTNETVQEKYTILSIEYPAHKNIKPMLALVPNKDRNFSSYEDFAQVQREEVKKLVLFIKSKSDTPPDSEVKFEERECY
jgi:GLPGLI family protein